MLSTSDGEVQPRPRVDKSNGLTIKRTAVILEPPPLMRPATPSPLDHVGSRFVKGVLNREAPYPRRRARLL